MAKYTFRTKTNDKKLDEILSSLQGRERADFIRNALYFYINYKNVLDNINNNILNIKETLNELKKSNISIEPIKEPAKDNNDVLKEMMNDFLNL